MNITDITTAWWRWPRGNGTGFWFVGGSGGGGGCYIGSGGAGGASLQ